MSDAGPSLRRKVLAFSAVAEIGTGVAFMIDPALVVTLLLGTDVTGAGIPLGRCFGIALVALGVACWPSRKPAASTGSAQRAMLVYNALIAAFLGWLGIAAHMGGLLLWPAVVLHAGVALLLASAYRKADAAVRP